MPRERSLNRDRAFEMWRDHEGKITNRELANILGEKEKTISNWKSRDKWNVVLQKNERSTTKRTRPNSGAPKGNKNAAGNIGGPGGPRGNKKAIITGEHETISWDALDDDERVLFASVDTDELASIDRTIRLMEVRERRMLLRIKELQNGPETVTQSETVTEQSSEQFGDSNGKTTVSESAVDRIQRIEEALTRVQEKKGKYIELRSKLISRDLREEEQRLKVEKLKAEITRMRGDDGETEDDGFIEALDGKVGDAWGDANES